MDRATNSTAHADRLFCAIEIWNGTRLFLRKKASAPSLNENVSAAITDMPKDWPLAFAAFSRERPIPLRREAGRTPIPRT